MWIEAASRSRFSWRATMLIVSGALSVALVALIYVLHKKQEWPSRTTFFVSGASILLGIVCSMPTFGLHAVLISIGTTVWKVGKWKTSYLLGYMVVSALGPYGFFTYLAFEHVAEHQRLADQYAFESMETRVSVPKKTKVKSSKETESHLEELERKVMAEGNGFREVMLDRLHRKSVQSFIESPGFGVGRRIRPTEVTLKVNLERDGSAIPQPEPLPTSTLSENDLKETRDVQPDALRTMHLGSVVDFVNPRGFGLIVNRQKVAGFQSHQFGEVPKAESWKVQSVELVGLLKHEEPAVYVSAELPRMDTLRTAPTRALNTFESAGLQKLQQGEDLFIRETPHGLRMLGAVRAIQKCTECHGGERGNLLGAFSYSLRRNSDK
jgi:hypothetical protein